MTVPSKIRKRSSRYRVPQELTRGTEFYNTKGRSVNMSGKTLAKEVVKGNVTTSLIKLAVLF